MNELKLWSFLLHKLNQGIDCGLLVVAEAQEPSPGKPGFKMAIAADGEQTGTIGGGAIEHTMIDLLHQKLMDHDPAPAIRRLHYQSECDAPVSGMICGGYQSIIAMILSGQARRPIAHLVTRIESRQPAVLCLSPVGIDCSFHPKTPALYFNGLSETSFQYHECLAPLPTVYIIGGGHVALALSPILHQLDFRVIILDDRPPLETTPKIKATHHIMITPFTAIDSQIPDDNSSYAVIMTPSHCADELVLRQLIAKPLAYLGMMGSPEKISEIFGRLKQSGISHDALQSVHAPIGLPIYSHTPAEIAVSIAAELILVRNRPDNQPS